MTGAVTGQLPGFPAQAGHNRLSVSECILRPATLDDLLFLRRLYRSFRKDELAQIPWSQDDKQAFLDQQFNLQHRYYIAAFPRTDFLIIEKDGPPIGRLYIDLGADIWHIIDIGFLPEWRGLGLGSATLKAIQNAATTGKSRGIVLHVDRKNRRAYDLYRALGFKVIETTDTHIRMEWLSHQLLPESTNGSSGVN
ncbi:GNAT family N-acetyltransferase [Rhizobium rhizogenes]|uniref:GNAT family N-acetyltransferase n=1 Tax=Rhizobium rhizogenes TaxID=359 RepID=UPI001572A5E2|nr:GNAT family N-acetyltransferase [Rhizobium rhizogenes]NTI26452.1 GNAT family N-acetyltransferase [Rhizobium rhizogenes]NTI65834.1 GNAT family N-acetyltransferase [Rhizobium rhizogenes]QTG08759.1 GNAT family N-acetyltransferase [Rhizobium rhizogenes]